MKLKLALFILVFSITFSCAENSTITNELKDNFSTEQIKDFETIVNFFKDQICEDTMSFESCFRKSMPDILSQGISFFDYDYDRQKNLYNIIDDSTFISIWSFCETMDIDTDKAYQSLCFNIEGDYSKFLKQIALKNSFFKDYYEDLVNSGDFDSSGKLLQKIAKNSKNFDFKNFNNQIIISIHYLTLVDQITRRR